MCPAKEKGVAHTLKRVARKTIYYVIRRKAEEASHTKTRPLSNGAGFQAGELLRGKLGVVVFK